ncbi:hypothetical protein BC827DRAFT_1155799 [Russula dissimulans]|nr:hypothetical protein BC827DRAFT_1155799 [Russula dissimulans]
MPVPVPQYSRPPVHPVFKQDRYTGDPNCPQPSAFPNLIASIPLPLPGPPPSFGTREEWISSLPLWRRNKPRRIWEEGDSRLATDSDMQDFPSGLIRAGNAQIIKGDRAQACIPPLLTLYQAEQPRHPQHFQEFEEEFDEIGSGTFDYEIESQWSGGTPRSEDLVEMEIDPTCDHQFVSTFVDGAYRASTTDVFLRQHGPHFDDSYPHEDASSEPIADADEDPASSPLGPITPFGVFVDRAVATSDFSDGPKVAILPTPFNRNSIQYGALPLATTLPYEAAGQAPDELPTSDIVPIPTATLSYKKVADPLAEWVATFVWKVCTTGMCLRTPYRGSIQQYSPPPPPYLANSVRSLLMSTLLQPSAVLLGVWYIVHLPVRFGRIPLRTDAVKEARFRLELLGHGEWRDSSSVQATEAHAPFRLVLLGCMLANKWLDDHTFSNKTWHTISGVPIQSLNRLESLALDIFLYDLSITPSDWNKWLGHVLAYHKSLSSAPNPQPISRPSSNPHFVVRKMIEDLLETASRSRDVYPRSHPQPVFLGLDERRRERLDPNATESSFETLEIDLDEDGPLREEYMPRRRISRHGSLRDITGNPIAPSFGVERGIEWERAPEFQRPLPPPAKWSPAADEPLRRDLVRESTNYMAVQPPPIPPLVMMPQYPASGHGMAYPQGWAAGAPTFHLAPHPIFGQTYDYGHVRSNTVIDGRHHHVQDGGHCRSQSQTCVEYSCNSSAPKLPYQIPALCWTGAEQYGYDAAYGQGFGHRLVVPQYGPNWVGH